MSIISQLKRIDPNGMALARWIGLTRWLIADQAPLHIIAATSEMVAGVRRKVRGELTRLYRNPGCAKLQRIAHDAMDAWQAAGSPGFGPAARIALSTIQSHHTGRHKDKH